MTNILLLLVIIIIIINVIIVIIITTIIIINVYQCLFGDILYYMSDTYYYLFGLFVLFIFLSLYSSSSPLLGSFFSSLSSHISIYHNKYDDDTDDNEYDNDNGRSIMIKIKIRMAVLVVNIIMIKI